MGSSASLSCVTACSLALSVAPMWFGPWSKTSTICLSRRTSANGGNGISRESTTGTTTTIYDAGGGRLARARARSDDHHPAKNTFGEMRATSVRDVLIYYRD